MSDTLNKEHIQSIIILGGGTAGWMTANKLIASWPHCKVTLIESEDIGTIGVGEGSTPYLKTFFAELGVNEEDWMPACSATYKVGIEFKNWSQGLAKNSYFHPFFSNLDKPSAELFFYNSGLRRRGFDAYAHPDDYFIAAEMMRKNVLPSRLAQQYKQIDYGYHFDSTKLGHFLRELAIKRGVHHKVDNVQSVQTVDNKKISALSLKEHGDISADFFIDCSGFASVLIEKSLKQQYVDYSKYLFNDSAVALQVKYDKDTGYTPKTNSIALKHGWMWEIPLTTRMGKGYVYSSQYCSAQDAENELREYTDTFDQEVKVRHLEMRVGRLNRHCFSNCLAVGMSQGFIEPLEATALMLSQYTITKFINDIEQEIFSYDSFNTQINTMFDGVRDYIVAHYKLSNRQDTAYWRDNSNNLHTPDFLSSFYTQWTSGGDVEQLLQINKDKLAYLRPSWYCIFSGMGIFPGNLQNTNKAADVMQSKNYLSTTLQKIVT